MVAVAAAAVAVAPAAIVVRGIWPGMLWDAAEAETHAREGGVCIGGGGRVRVLVEGMDWGKSGKGVLCEGLVLGGGIGRRAG